MIDRNLIKLINQVFDMRGLLAQLGAETYGSSSCLCPFHPDSHKSAKFFPDDNSLRCFAESMTYRPWDALQALGYSELSILNYLMTVDPSSVAAVTKKDPPSIIEPMRYNEALRLKSEFIQGRATVEDYMEHLGTCLVWGLA